jgi:hypothetical protein
MKGSMGTLRVARSEKNRERSTPERIQFLNNVQSQTITPTKGTAVESGHVGINSYATSDELGAQNVSPHQKTKETTPEGKRDA